MLVGLVVSGTGTYQGYYGHTKTPPMTLLEKNIFGVDCHSPTEAEITPSSNWDPMFIADYREELMLSLSSARQLANETYTTSTKEV